MSTRTGRVVRWTRDASGAGWAVIQPHLTQAEVEAEADALLASLPVADQRKIEAQRPPRRVGKDSVASGAKTPHASDGEAAAAV